MHAAMAGAERAQMAHTTPVHGSQLTQELTTPGMSDVSR